ncbi:hypothetical protein [Streptomyces sp. DH10]|uniref:hypothetical protein n=1 Tax=Streptomyces sp. DH10 TaxID=3040121 RepID=UPI0024417DFC|nr:hypothetical protein [Streptomyces sp. DH10]MDG9708954.1 hypothetical protein [Streptomyces sp. DH10]
MATCCRFSPWRGRPAGPVTPPRSSPTPRSAGAALEDTLGAFQRQTGTNAATDMSPATAGELFGGTRVDLGTDEALAAARDFGPDLVIAETADFLGPLAASRLGVPWASHGVGIAPEEHESEDGTGWRAPVFPGREHLPRVLVTPRDHSSRVPGKHPAVVGTTAGAHGSRRHRPSVTWPGRRGGPE